MNLRAIPLMLSMIPSTLRGASRADLERLAAIARASFPSVRQMSPAEASAALEKPDTLLIDVRSPEEFAVSHLKGAVNLRRPQEILKLAAEKPRGQILLYCAAGFRSSSLAARLQKRGLANVANLEGAIFAWANEGRPLYRGGERVSEVHPFSGKWSALLDEKAAQAKEQPSPPRRA